MLDILYFVFIAPLEAMMHAVLNFSYTTLHSYGWALVMMSLFVNTAILPIYNKAEQWQEEERELKNRMSDQEAMIRRAFKGQERFSMLATLHRQHGYSPFMPLRASVGFLLQIPFFFAAYHLLSNLQDLHGQTFGFISNLGTPDAWLNMGSFSINVLPILMTLLNFVSAFVYTQNLTTRDKIQLYGMAILFLVLLYDSPAALTLYWTLNNLYSLGKNIVSKNLLPKIAQIQLSKPKLPITLPGRLLNARLEGFAKLFWPSYLLCTLFIFAYYPIQIYFSDPLAFTETESNIFYQLGLWFEIAITLGLLVWIAIPKWFKHCLGFLLGGLALMAIVYAFILTPDYGSIDSFKLQNESLLYERASNRLKDLALLVGLLLTLGCLSFFQKISILKPIMWSMVAVVAGLSAFNYMKAIPIAQDVDASGVSSLEPPKAYKEMMTFSASGKNIVVVMLDTFTGGNMKEILDKDPSIRDALDGFTWYADTVTSGSFTIFGKPPILGGEEVHPLTINQKNNELIEEQVNREWGKLITNLQQRNFDVSIAEFEFLRPDMLNKHLERPANLITSYLPWSDAPKYWKQKEPDSLEVVSVDSTKFLTSMGLFKVSPLSLRRKIYRNGTWLKSVNTGGHGYEKTIDKLASLAVLPDFSYTNKNVGNTFRFFVNELPHPSWHMNKYCKPTFEGYWRFDKYRDSKTGIWENHIITEICSLKALIDWFDWMKRNQVYDNTHIIIVSDHGRWDSSELLDMWSGNQGYKKEAIYPVALHGLLLVKDTNSKGPMKEDRENLMANWDVPLLIKAASGEATKQPWKNPNRQRCSVNGEWQRKRHNDNAYNIKDVVCVNGSLFKKEHWKTFTYPEYVNQKIN